VIVRLAVLLAAACAFTAVLAVAAATPAFGEREWTDFRTCIASIQHPALPAALLTRDAAAENRALALLGAEDTCAHASGIDGSGRERALEWLHAQRPGASERNGAAEFFTRCSEERRASRGVFAQIGMGVDCYMHSGGLTGTQFELSTGFNPEGDFLNAHMKDVPILAKRRFPRTMLHARDGTWWYHSCS
jgi:hypothetical protein